MNVCKIKNTSVGIVNLGVRKEIMKEIKKLRQEGIKVDYPEFPTRLATITSILKNIGLNVEILDLDIMSWLGDNAQYASEDLRSFLKGTNELILMHIRQNSLSQIYRLANILSKIKKLGNNKIILISANATKDVALMILKKLKDYLDAIVYGEIELPFLLSNLSFEALRQCPNVIYLNGSKVKNNTGYLTEDMMNKLPLPAFNDFAYEKYLQLNNYIPINLSRGCPFHCKHCAVREVYGKYWKSFQLEKVFEIIRQFKDLTKGKAVLSLNDEDVIFDLEWFRGINKIFKSLDVSWECKLRPDLFSDEVVNILSSGNCRNVTISADVLYDYNPELAQDIGKIITLKTLKRAFSLCRTKEIKATLAVIPEFYPTIESILNLIEECKVSSVALCPLRTFDTFPKDEFTISPILREIIYRMENKGLKVSILTGMGEQGW